MKDTIKLIKILPILLVLMVTGCSLDAPDHPEGLAAPQGSQLFAKYGSIGNSLTAGFMDGGLIMNGQVNSFPTLIAGQIGLDNSVSADADFTQPYIAFPGIGTGTDSLMVGKLSSVLYFNGAGIEYLDYTPLSALQSLALMATLPTPYHNLGVPGAATHDVMNTIESATNPYYTLINRASFFGNTTVAPIPGVAPGYETASMFRQAVAKGPTLMTVWIGNNDILGGATSGNPSAGNVTDPLVFRAQYEAMMLSLAQGLFARTGFPATLVVGNIPAITDIPYFMPLALFEQAVGGPWPGGYEDANVELVLFPTLSWASPGNAGNQVPAEYTLTTAEAAFVAATVTEYNTHIDAVIAAVHASPYADCILADMNEALAEATTEYGPMASMHFLFALDQLMDPVAAARATLFSLDGIHPNNIGYGFTANKFIEALNAVAGTSVADIDLTGLTWDPNYGQGYPAPPPPAAPPEIRADIAGAMNNLFR